MKQERNPFSAGKKSRLNFSLAAAVYLALGLLMLLAPNTSRKLLCTLIGAGAIVYGLLSILPSLIQKGERSFSPALLIGICALAFGVFSLLNPTFLMDFFFTVLGVIVCMTSAVGIRRALNLRAFGFARWWAPLFSSVATLLLALCVIFFSGFFGNMLMMAMGIILILGAVSDLLSIHLLSGYSKRVTITYTVGEK